MMMVKYQIKNFEELTLSELYDILRLRVEIFIVEQDCPYQDLDYKDQKSHHLIGIHEGKIISYVRLLPKGISYENHCSIGRVVNDQKYRGKGLGKELMNEALKTCKQLFPDCPIKISAQLYLLNFYTKLGFQPVGESYLEDNIPHIAMTLSYL